MPLNSGHQLLIYIINERLKRIVEQVNVFQLRQGGGKQGRCVNINIPKSNETDKQEKWVYQVDIDIWNAFNAMSQAALWHVTNMFHLPDVDLLKQIITALQCVWPQTMQKVQQSRVIQV